MAQAGEEHKARDGISGNCRPPLAREARELLESLDTGDLVLFDRPCLKMGGFFGAAVCAAAKVLGGSPFDHIGVVVKDENGLNAMVEASFSGVAVRPLCERVRRSSASQICVRRLQAHRTEEMRAEARQFVAEVAHLPYKEGGEGLLQMVAAAFRFHPAREQRRRCHAEAVALSTSIASLERELTAHPEVGDPTQDVVRERLRRAITRRRKALLFLDAATPSTSEPPKAQAPPPPAAAAAAVAAAAAAAQAEPRAVGGPPAAAAEPAPAPTHPSGDKHQRGGSLPPNLAPLDPGPAHQSARTPSPLPPSSSPSFPSSSSPSSSASTTPPPIFPPPYYDGGMFCSELVAALYQRLGLLDAPFPARHDYVPADFAQSLANPTGCLGIDAGKGSTTKDAADTETTTVVDTRGDRTTSKDKTRRRTQQSDDQGPSCVAASLPPPIPEGGGRVALLRGAALGPGCWLRSGPPSLGGEEEEEEAGGGEGEEEVRRSRREGGGGGRGPMPLAAAPMGTSSSSRPRPHFRHGVAAAAADDAAAVVEFGKTDEDGKVGTPLFREIMARHHRSIGVGDSRRCLFRWSSRGRLLSAYPRDGVAAAPFRIYRGRPLPLECPNSSGMGGRRKKHPAEPIGQAVEVPPFFFSPIGVVAAAATAAAAVAASPAAWTAFAGSRISNPVVSGRCGPLLMLAGSGAAACFTAGGMAAVNLSP